MLTVDPMKISQVISEHILYGGRSISHCFATMLQNKICKRRFDFFWFRIKNVLKNVFATMKLAQFSSNT